MAPEQHRDGRKGPYTRLSVTVTGMSCCVVMLAMLVGCMASLVLKYVPNWCRTLGVKKYRLACVSGAEGIDLLSNDLQLTHR